MESEIPYVIKWAPVPQNQYAISHAHEISLYDYDYNSPFPSLHSSITFSQHVRCFEWSKSKDKPFGIMCALNNGKIILADPTKDGAKKGIFEKEFCGQLMKIRKCNSIKWNSVLTNLVACSYEPLKDEESLYVWDIEKEPIKEQSTDLYYGGKVTGALKLKTKREKIEDLAWIPDTHSQILAVTDKMVRVYDTRRAEEDVNHIVLKKDKGLFSGVTFDPNNAKRFLIYYGNEVTLWDLGLLREPVFSFKHSPNEQGIADLCVEWVGDECGLLASAFRGADPIVNYWYLKDSLIKKEKDENMRPVKSKSLYEGESISSFTVIPNTLDLLAVFHSGTVSKCTYKLVEHPAIDINPNNETCFSLAKSIYSAAILDDPLKIAKIGVPHTTSMPPASPKSSDLQKSPRNPKHKPPTETSSVEIVSFAENYTEFPDTDISRLMLLRAASGYGLDIGKNAALSQKFCSKGLGELWNFIALSHMVSGIDRAWNNPLKGIAALIRSFPIHKTIAEKHEALTVYTSELRSKILACCGWVPQIGKNAQLSDLCKRLEGYRAAAIAAFHLDLFECSAKLGNVVAGKAQLMVIKGAIHSMIQDFSGMEMNNSNDKRFYVNFSKDAEDPYLQLLFAFISLYRILVLILNSDKKRIKEIFRERKIYLLDQIAFMTRYFNDEDILEETEKLLIESFREGLIEGVILTGITPDALKIIQSYLDNTGDIQTAAYISVLLEVHCGLYNEPTLGKFINAYETFLNKQRQWEIRANFTIKRNEIRKRIHLGKEQIHLPEEKKKIIDPYRLRARCGFCGQNFDKSAAEEVAAKVIVVPTEQKMISNCPKCANSLPRCAICLSPLSLLNPFLASSAATSKQKAEAEIRKNKEDNFFVWCQKCRHGGHLKHIEEWFLTHNECPVSECTCHCHDNGIAK